jgi:valyl-tRNA synthetase
VPFRELYIHALVRDAEKQKMSKTKGNVIDPLEVTEKYGTDAVRFALAISAAPGTDIAFSVEKIESYRAFANKIWNAGRFILMNLEKLPEAWRAQLAEALRPVPELGFTAAAGLESLAPADRWIFSRLQAVIKKVDEALAEFRFHEATYEVYHFFWHEICDWYLEWVKPEITRPAEGPRVTPAWINLGRVFESALHLLHPFMPFITEELGRRLPRVERESSISLTRFRLAGEGAADPVAEKQFSLLQELIVALRNAKAEMGLQKVKPSAQVSCEAPRWLELARTHLQTILRLSAFEALSFTRDPLDAAAAGVRSGPLYSLRVFHEAPVDHDAERARLRKEKEKLEHSLAQVKAQLENPEFLDRAPQQVVRATEHRHSELQDRYTKVMESLERLA